MSLTEDKHFGEFAHASGARSVGVALPRVPASGRSNVGDAMAELVSCRGEGLVGRLVVVQAGKSHIGPQPSD